MTSDLLIFIFAHLLIKISFNDEADIVNLAHVCRN